ncbi:MAG TPA: hypothetical protein VFE41_08510 [Acetobacteraceae bacterium]|nr:hypothetical protein [Acetobacteraceae bacterium]
MRMILFASIATMALASCADPIQTSSDAGANTAAGAGSPSCLRLAPSPDGPGSIPTACPFVRDPSYTNPTGEVTRGPHGEISLFAAHAGGSR